MPAPLSRQAIVAVARQMIIDEGLASVSLRRIAATLDVTAPALYAYVTNKRDLLRAVAEDELSQLITRFQLVESTDPVERVEAYCRAYIDHARATPELYPVIFLFPPAFESAASITEEIPLATDAFTLPAAAVTEAIASGAFRDIDPVQASLGMFAAAHGAVGLLHMGFGFDRATEDQMVDSVIETAIIGLSGR